MEEKADIVVANEPSGLERLGAVVCHTGAFIGLNIIIPLVFVLVLDKKTKPFVYQHAKQALVFQIATFAILLGIIFLGSGLTVTASILTATVTPWVVAFMLLTGLFGLGALVLISIASYKAATGQAYKYPFLKRF